MSETSTEDAVAAGDAPLSPPLPVGARVMYALRQAAFLGVGLVIASAVTERLDPAGTAIRGLVSTPFLWAAVVWLLLLLFQALAFERSQLQALDSWPLIGSLCIGAFMFVTGLIALDGGNFGRRLVYVFANSLGAVMFWWAALGLCLLVIQRMREGAT